MQPQQLFLKVSYSSIFVLFFSIAFVSTSPALTTDSSGLCCANNILKETTEKQCSKAKGKYYSAKEKKIAQKECRSLKPAVSGKTSVVGFCCNNGVVQKASQAQCSRLKGSYYTSSALAKKNCTPKKIFCCVDGKVSERSSGECKKRKGTAYASAAEAKKKCKPADIYCCTDGKIKKTSPQQCKQHKGTAYKTVTEAKRKCKPADIYCCVAGKNIKTSAKQCAQRKGTAYTTISEAKRQCKPQVVYCCIDGKISRISSKQCRSKQGKEYITQLIAKKSCGKQITGFASAGKPVSGSKNNHLVQTLALSASPQQRKIAGNASLSQVSARGVSSVVGSIQNGPATGTRLLSSPTDPNWTTVSGDVTATSYYHLQHVLAQRIGSPSPASNRRNIITPILNKSYSLSLPPSSTWLIQPVTSEPLNFKEIRPFSITTSAEGESVTRDIVLERDDRTDAYYEAGDWCNFSGTVTFNGQIPTENIFIRLTPQGDGLPARNWPLTLNGTFSFKLPAGQYVLQPHSLTNPAYDNTIAAQEYICPENYSEEIRVNFDYVQPQLCVLSGHVLNNGQRDAEIRSLTLRTADGSIEPFTIPVTPSGDYRIELPVGKSYTIIPVVPEHWQAPSRYAFRIAPTESEKTLNVEVFQPEFQLGELVDIQVRTNPGNIAPSIKVTFETLLTGGSQEGYNQTVRITSPTYSQVNILSNCVFSADGSCSMEIWMDGFDVQGDSLRAQIVGLEDLPGSSRDYPVPFRNMAGDLTLLHGGVLTVDRAPGSATFHFEVKNLGPVNSRYCDVSIKINQLAPVKAEVPSLATGRTHLIEKRLRTNLDVGDVVVFQINNECDPFTENNELSFTIQDIDEVDHRDHVPVEEDNTEHVQMTGEAESFWDWFF